MQSSDVQIHTGSIAQKHTMIDWIEAKRSKRTAFSADPTLDEVNAELRQKAAEMGANAVIQVDYTRGMSLMSYGVLTARGLAVVLESDTKTCPSCAETIKQAAVKCRFCGVDV